MFYQKRLIIFGSLFLLVVVLDWLKFIFFGGPNLLNWHSFIHPAWVFATLALLFLGTRLKKPKVWQLLFGVNFLIFFLALINQYKNFSSVLTYNCMLFNLVFVAIYLLVSAPAKSDDPD